MREYEKSDMFYIYRGRKRRSRLAVVWVGCCCLKGVGRYGFWVVVDFGRSVRSWGELLGFGFWLGVCFGLGLGCTLMFVGFVHTGSNMKFWGIVKLGIGGLVVGQGWRC